MPIIQRRAFVPYSAANMYQLVNDIDAYPEFLTWCKRSEVHQCTDSLVEATLELSKGPLHKSFTTRNTLQTNKMIEMRLLNGPFKHLEGFWRFHEIDQHSCEVLFDLNFEFSTKPLHMIAGPVFQQIANNLVQRFCERAKVIYGKV